MGEDYKEERENAELSCKRRNQVAIQSCEIPMVGRFLRKETLYKTLGKSHLSFEGMEQVV
jgi:hypothetical protein